MKITDSSLWKLNTHSTNLSVLERKEAYLLIVYLNTYQTIELALYNLRKDWLKFIYPLPKTDNKNYNVIKTGRYATMKRLNRIYRDYLIQIK